MLYGGLGQVRMPATSLDPSRYFQVRHSSNSSISVIFIHAWHSVVSEPFVEGTWVCSWRSREMDATRSVARKHCKISSTLFYTTSELMCLSCKQHFGFTFSSLLTLLKSIVAQWYTEWRGGMHCIPDPKHLKDTRHLDRA